MLLLLWLSIAPATSLAFQGVLLPENGNGQSSEHQTLELSLSNVLQQQAYNIKINQAALLCKDVCQSTSADLFTQILTTYPDTELVFFYDVQQADVTIVTVVDPFSMDLLARATLPKTAAISETQRINDLGILLLEELTQRQVKQTLTIRMSKFSIDEMAPVSSFLLSLSANNQIKLLETAQLDEVFSSFMPILQTTYALTTDVSVSHLIDEFRRYWDLQGIKVRTDYDRLTGELVIVRVGVPYWPSLLLMLVMLIVCLLSVFWYLRRRNIQLQLSFFSDKRKVDDWLELYDATNKPWVRLNPNLINQASYWRQIKRESQQLEKQAKLFYEAGDVNTSKLFISKALNINASAPDANKLVLKIQQDEKNKALLNEDEQWIRNKIAKAMINLRNDNYYKALRQAYQAEARCGQQKALKRQLKAIKKLVNKILFQSAFRIDRVQIKLTDDIGVLSIGREEQVYIGRDDNWIAAKGVGVMQFLHKGLSRIGQHAKLSFSEQGLSITELGSTNGTYINKTKLAVDDDVYLQHGDVLLLAAKNTRMGLAQRLTEASKNRDFYCLEFPSDMTKEGFIADYTKVWSDYMLSVHRKFVLSRQALYVCLDNDSKQLFAAMQPPEPAQGKALFIISLMPYLTISPVPSLPIKLNNEEVLGKTAIELPAEITCKSHKIQILANEFSYISEYTKSNFQSELKIKDVEK